MAYKKEEKVQEFEERVVTINRRERLRERER